MLWRLVGLMMFVLFLCRMISIQWREPNFVKKEKKKKKKNNKRRRGKKKEEQKKVLNVGWN